MRKLLRNKRPKESWLKYIMSVLHLWFGLFASLIVISVCLSGCIYAFKTQIENVIQSELVYHKEVKEEFLKINQITADFEANYGRITQLIVYPGSQCKNIKIDSRDRGVAVTVYYNPYTAEKVGEGSIQVDGFFRFVLEWHTKLWMGDSGKLIIGIGVLIFTFLLISGVIIWIPKKVSQLKKALSIKFKAKFSRLNYDLHRTLGIYSSILLLIIAITGLYVSFHWFKNAIVISLGGESIVLSESNDGLKNQLANSFNDLLTSVQNEASDSIIQYGDILNKVNSELKYEGEIVIIPSQDELGLLDVVKYDNDNLFNFTIPNKLVLSSGASLLKKELFTNLSLSNQFQAIAKPLHTGEIMGVGSVFIYFVVSFIGMTLPITGFLIWWRKKK